MYRAAYKIKTTLESPELRILERAFKDNKVRWPQAWHSTIVNLYRMWVWLIVPLPLPPLGISTGDHRALSGSRCGQRSGPASQGHVQRPRLLLLLSAGLYNEVLMVKVSLGWGDSLSLYCADLA